jgi:hypothetical protein
MDLAEPKLPDVSSMPPARLEAACALIGVYCGPKVNDGQIRDELADIAGSGFLGDDTGPVGCVLIRAEDDEDLAWRVGELRRRLSAPSWVAVTGQWGAKIREGRAEVHHVAAIAVASGRPPGLYRVADLPVEYAVLRQPPVLRRLLEIISPIVDQPVLCAALESLTYADGNRSRAAVEIGIHHSTLVYRLRQIRELTGLDPTSARGLTVLSTALTVHCAVRGDILRGIPDTSER